MQQLNPAAQVKLSAREAKMLLAPAVARWLAFMTEHRLQLAAFRVESDGHHDDRTAIEVGLHCELLEERGCEIVSHSVAFANTPQGPKTLTSLLVRAPNILTVPVA